MLYVLRFPEKRGYDHVGIYYQQCIFQRVFCNDGCLCSVEVVQSDDNLKNVSMSIANISPCKMPYGGENDSWQVTGGEEVCPTHPLIPHHLHPASVCLNVAL